MATIKVSAQNVVIKPVLNVYNGRFYSGMTLTEAQERSLDKRRFGRDFKQIDKDKDGILSDEEILKERVVANRRAGIGHSLITAALTLWTILDFNKDAFKKNKVLETCLLVFDISLIGIELLNSIRSFSGLKKAKEVFANYQAEKQNSSQVEH